MIFRNKVSDLKAIRSSLLANITTLDHRYFGKDLKLHVKEVALFGASSQVGICILRRLISLGIKVLIVYNNTKLDFTHPNVTTCHSSELNNYKAHLKYIIFVSPINYIVNYKSHFIHTKKLICFSSTSVIAKASSSNIYEQALVLSLKNSEKNISDIAKELNFDLVILRPTLIYGVGMDKNITAIKKFIEKFKFFLLHPPAKGKRQPVHADDLAMAAICCLNNSKIKNKTYNLGGGEILSYHQMVKRVFEIMNKKPLIFKTKLLGWMMDLYGKIMSNPGVNKNIATRMNQDLTFDYKAATKDFGYKPRKFDNIILKN